MSALMNPAFFPLEIQEESSETWPTRRVGHESTGCRPVEMPFDKKEERRDQSQKIRRLLKPLTREEKRVLYLKFLKKASDEAIARKLKCSVEEVSGRVVDSLLKANLLFA